MLPSTHQNEYSSLDLFPQCLQRIYRRRKKSFNDDPFQDLPRHPLGQVSGGRPDTAAETEASTSRVLEGSNATKAPALPHHYIISSIFFRPLPSNWVPWGAGSVFTAALPLRLTSSSPVEAPAVTFRSCHTHTWRDAACSSTGDVADPSRPNLRPARRHRRSIIS